MGILCILVHNCAHSITGATGLNSKKPDQLYYILVYRTHICVHIYPPLLGGVYTDIGRCSFGVYLQCIYGSIYTCSPHPLYVFQIHYSPSIAHHKQPPVNSIIYSVIISNCNKYTNKNNYSILLFLLFFMTKFYFV